MSAPKKKRKDADIGSRLVDSGGTPGITFDTFLPPKEAEEEIDFLQAEADLLDEGDVEKFEV